MNRCTFLAVLLMSCLGRSAYAQKVQYAREIQPILAAHCFHCHGPDAKTQKAGLRLDEREGALKSLRSGSRAIVPKHLAESELIARIEASDESRMPPAKSKDVLKDHEKELLKRWIAEGAEYQRHWSFVPPAKSELPVVKASTWPKTPIDRFVLARLEAAGMQPSAEADRYTLARRVSIDLTGLPPTLALVDRFVQDKSPEAYEKFVDQMLESPAFGERWAQVWLDLARYADSRGYATDNARSIWKYRDWVIDAYNRNLPFDQFTIEQIAGDLLPNPTRDQLLATAFHRNTLTNDEGGTNDEEFRVAAVVDRVNTTVQVWMGLSMTCAQCHDHKYDPVSQEEYFRVFAIFNQSEDADRGDDSPLLSVIEPEDQKKKTKLEAEIARLDQELQGPNLFHDAFQSLWELGLDRDKQPAPIKAALVIALEKRNAKQKSELQKAYRATTPPYKPIVERVEALRKELSNVPEAKTPIMRELPEKSRRTTKIQIRGNFLDPGKVVSAGVPAMFHPLPTDQGPDRLALARWLVAKENPLTARVTVNRFWDQIFGLGVVETPDDFGVRGKQPTNPELLDWLASDFVAQGWDVKKLLKMLVTSATYRQTSQVSASLQERDPENRYLARGPRFRSSAEVIRDQTLAVSGLLSSKMHGPSVRPPQPKLGLSAAFGGGTDWQNSAGEDKYRRALYTQWRRTTPYPSLVTFDAPSRTVCTISRARTNTPLQALVTLNDPVYVEAAQALGRRIVREGGSSVEDRIRFGFRLCLVRPPSEKEAERLVDLYQQALTKYREDRKQAEQFATDPIGPLPTGGDAADFAAWTLVGNVLLNLDETFVKR